MLWKEPIGVGYAGPAVANGKVFVMDYVAGERTKSPKADSRRGSSAARCCVICRSDAATGCNNGRQNTPSNTPSAIPPGRDALRLLMARSLTPSAMGDLKAHKASDGKEVWSKNFMKDYDAGLPVGFASHPLVDGDKLIYV